MKSPFLALLLLASSPLAQAFPALPQSKPESLVHKSNVFLGDNRKELKDTKAPWGAVGKLITPNGQGCTASLVGPDLLLTAAHCVVEDKKVLTGNYIFYAGFKRGNFSAKSGVSRIWVGTKEPGTERENDWAILRLNKRLGDQVGWFGVYQAQPEELLQLHETNVIYMAGYSDDKWQSQVPVWQRDCEFKSHLSTGLLSHTCSGIPGASGSPMFVFLDKPNGEMESRIVALHNAERRNDRPSSQFNIPFSETYANLAAPASKFFDLLVQLKN